MFGPIQPTQYDLAFSLLGIPVRVTPWFFLVGVLLGRDWARIGGDAGPLLLIIWVGVMFVSILVHELGHACFAALFGYPPSIMLHQFGGVTLFQPTHAYTTAKAILITAAGPAFGAALGVAAWLTPWTLVAGDAGIFWRAALYMLMRINFGWTLINLLPVLPLDGGLLCREVCLAASPRRGLETALWMSVLAGGLFGVWCISERWVITGLMFLMMAAQSYQEIQQRRAW